MSNIYVIGHQLEPMPTTAPFEERKTFLFVGAMHGTDNPNADSMRYFCAEIWPSIYAATGAELEIVGYGTDVALSDLKCKGVRVHGTQSDLTEVFNRARVFVAPTRYSAGIPYKAHEAAARGVPLVISQIIGEQLAWADGEDCMVANSAGAFAEACCRVYADKHLWERLRTNALERVRVELGDSTFSKALRAVLNETSCSRSSSSVREVSSPDEGVSGT